METYLRCFASDKPKTWVKFLPWAEYSYNSSFHSSIQMSPFKGVYGREPPVLMKYETGPTSNAELEGQLLERDETLLLLKEHLHRAQQRMKARADESRREVLFEIGDMVFLKLRPYRQQTLAKRANEKLSARFYGPYEVEARVGEVAYRLKLPADAKIHHTFHVSQLKRMIGEGVVSTPLPSQLNTEGVLETEPEKIVQVRVNAKSGQEEVLVKWKGLPEFDCTWENKAKMQAKFSDFNLEDKVNFDGQSIDTYGATHPPIIYTYQRKKASTSVN